MLNFGSRTFFIGGFITGLVALFYTIATGDYSGKVLLLSATAALFGLGAASLTATGAAERFNLPNTATASSPADERPSIAPFVGALGIGVVGLGAALGVAALVAGIIVLLVGGIMWFVASWRSHPDHVSAITSRVSDRFSMPFGMPIAMLGLILGIAYAVSRSLLAASKIGSIFVIAIVAIAIFAGGFILAARPTKQGLVKILAVFAAISFVVMFIVGQAAGHRSFGEEHNGKSGEKVGVEKK